ncbi:ankyrin repeat-containing domain protein [Aspergillus crustosus]
MAACRLLQLPEELILDITKYLGTPSLAAFMQTCQIAQRIAHPELYSPRHVPQSAYTWALKHNQNGTLCSLLPVLLPLFKKVPQVGFGNLMSAVRRGNAYAVRTLLDHGVRPSPGEEYTSALREAAQTNNTEVVSLLLDVGAHTPISEYGYFDILNPQKCSVWETGFDDSDRDDRNHNSIDVARMLIPRGLRLDIVDDKGKTPLHRARSLEEAEILLDSGVDVNMAGPGGETALFAAVRSCGSSLYYGPSTTLPYGAGIPCAKAPEFARLLLSRGARVNQTNDMGLSPLHLAATDRTPEIISLLIDAGAELGQQDDYKDTVVDSLLYDSAPEHRPQARMHAVLDGAGSTAVAGVAPMERLLEAAVENRWHDTIQRLLASPVVGANATLKEHCYAGLLLRAAAALEDVAMMKTLLPLIGCARQRGRGRMYGHWWEGPADDTTGALFLAIQTQNDEAVELLAQSVHSFDDLSTQGRTPLAEALACGTERAVKLILPRSTWLVEKDRTGQSPVSLAVKYRSAAVVRLVLDRIEALISHGLLLIEERPSNEICAWRRPNVLESLESCFKQPFKSWDLESVRVLLEYTVKFGLQDKGFHGSLCYVIEQKREDIALLMLQFHVGVQGWYGNDKRKSYWPLGPAVDQGYSAVVKALIDHGTDLDLQCQYRIHRNSDRRNSGKP